MSALGTHTAHARQRASTRTAILDAALAMVRDEPAESFTHEAIAVRTGVAARTIYRHFPARADLVAALWERLRDETGTRWPTTESEILQAVRAQFAQFEAHAPLVRAGIVASASADYPTYGSAEGRAAFRQSLAAVLDDLPPEEGDRLVASCVAVYSAPFWQMLRDRGQLAGEDAAEAAAGVLEAVIEAARARGRRKDRR
jgi:AcrR family transcriptional regulator